MNTTGGTEPSIIPDDELIPDFSLSLPMILVANPTINNPNANHFLLDKWWEPEQKKLNVHTFPFVNHRNSYYKALFSNAGLVVFVQYHSHVIHFIFINPITLEKVTVFLAREIKLSHIYGVFYHPSSKEYCSLWGIELSRTSFDQPRRIVYKVLNLGSSPSMKTVCNPFTHRFKDSDTRPLFIDKYLYWLLKAEQKEFEYNGHCDIMQFDIIEETFTVKPCPVPEDTHCHSRQRHLLNIDGALCFLVIFTSEFTIWTLVDHVEKLWTSVNYTSNFKSALTRPIAAVDGSLVFSDDGTLVIYNLMQRTMKDFRRKRYSGDVLFLSHQVSLASLSNCPSTIYLNEKGEVDVMEDSDNSGSTYSVDSEDSDSKLEDSASSNPLCEESTSFFKIANTNDVDEEMVMAHEDDWKKTIKLAYSCASKGVKATKQELHSSLKAILELAEQRVRIVLNLKAVETPHPWSKAKGSPEEVRTWEKGGPEEVWTWDP